MGRSEELFERAKRVMPGGVNSPVRAFRSVRLTPRMISRADGCFLYDVDKKRYVDYIGSWGPMILGHNFPEVREAVLRACEDGLSFGCATEREVQMAELITQNIPHVEMIRMVNSGTEAVMSAIRAARGFTGRNKVVKFSGCYHGHTDAMLISAGSGVMTAHISDSAGVPAGCVADTLIAAYNDLQGLTALFEESEAQAKGEEDKIAAVIVEPVAANMGVVLPEPGFLQGLRRLCTEHGAMLIFDEVITGFRLAFGGAAERFSVTPDLVTYGKIIGGGMPVGAYGGRRDIMECVAPLGSVYQAGTLSGNPIAMAAGLAMLHILKNNSRVYEELEERGSMLFEGIRTIVREKGLPYQVNSISSLGCLFFTEHPVKDYETAKRSDTESFAVYYRKMLEKGFYLAPSQFEAIFLSTAHTTTVLNETLEAMREAL